jgi:hypothetical protein
MDHEQAEQRQGRRRARPPATLERASMVCGTENPDDPTA